MILRPYQHRALTEVRRAWLAGSRRILLVMPTGSGKTLSAASFVAASVSKGKRVLWLAHRRELIEQGSDTLTRLGVPNGMVLPEHPEIEAPVQVASLQTLYCRAGTRPPADLVVHDEAHHDTAATFRAVAEAYPDATHLGLTATPERGDGTGLGNVYQALVAPVSIPELVAGGFLVPCDVVAPATGTSDLAWDPLAAWQTHAQDRQTVVFCPNVAYAVALAGQFTAAGVPTGTVDGEQPTRVRENVLARFAAGDLRVVTNVYVLTEGWDCPATAVCVLARGCGSVAMYLQMVGRVLRPAPGKTRALLLDLRGVVHEHGLPDEAREYSLDGAPIRPEKNRIPLRQCPACGGVAKPAPVCRCGWVFPPPKAPIVRAQGLVPVTRLVPREEKQRVYDDLAYKAHLRGYQPGWVAHQFRARFGHWPRGFSATVRQLNL